MHTYRIQLEGVKPCVVSWEPGKRAARARRHIRAVIHKFRRKIHVADVQILPVHKFLKMVSDKLLHLRMSHSGLGVDELLGLRFRAHCHPPFRPLRAGRLAAKAVFVFFEELIQCERRSSEEFPQRVRRACAFPTDVILL